MLVHIVADHLLSLLCNSPLCGYSTIYISMLLLIDILSVSNVGLLCIMIFCSVQSLSHVQLFVTPWTAAHQLLCPWDSPGKNTGVSSHSLLQGIFPTQGLNLGFLHCRQILYHLSHQEAQRCHSVSDSRSSPV